MAVAIAVIMGLLAGVAAKAGMKTVAKFFGIVAFLAFMGWLASGPGEAILNWIDNPSVDVPSVDINR